MLAGGHTGWSMSPLLTFTFCDSHSMIFVICESPYSIMLVCWVFFIVAILYIKSIGGGQFNDHKAFSFSFIQLNAFVNTIYYGAVGTVPTKMVNNFRPLQPLKSRTVYASKDATISHACPLAENVLFPLLSAVLVAKSSSGPS